MLNYLGDVSISVAHLLMSHSIGQHGLTLTGNGALTNITFLYYYSINLFLNFKLFIPL